MESAETVETVLGISGNGLVSTALAAGSRDGLESLLGGLGTSHWLCPKGAGHPQCWDAVESQTQSDLFSILSQLRYPGWSGRLALVGGQPFSFAFGLAHGFSASCCHG